MIVHTEDTLGGRARIDGHRIAVWHLAELFDEGLTDEQVVDIYYTLNAEKVAAARSYYKLHPEEIAFDIQENCLEDGA